MPSWAIAIIAVVCCLVGVGIGCAVTFLLLKRKKDSAMKQADALLEGAKEKSERLLENAKLEAKAEKEELLRNAEKDISERKKQVLQTENKLDQRENALDKREDAIIQREEFIDQKRNSLEAREESLSAKEKDYQAKVETLDKELERVAGLSMEDAKKEILAKVEEREAKRIALYREQMEEEAESQVQDKAKAMLAMAMDKFAQDVTSEHSTSTVALPSDEMKGRIIGREGRNIKSMEQIFGVSLIIDDTPETITCSCFDPIRREKAKLTLEALIKDGRIQPGRIEDLYRKISTEFDDSLRRIGEQTVFKLGLPRISGGLLPYIGRLKYRTSYGQNVLDHSIQVAYLSSVMAAELGLDPVMAKRAGLLHDIGKAIDAEQEGSHVQLGSQLAKKFNEPEAVINAIESHHGDAPKKYLTSELVQAADTLSAARPGARSETLETYIKRLEQIEGICKSFDGVQSSYALQSGRDVRVMVVPEKISDEDAKAMAIQIRDKIESEMQFPGQIKISVIRETRAVQVAK
ncbi:MAG TPA: ribonuclease Y [Candidatus Enterosoma merdigallinarum]|nr:ribonuclease Y [Candidatus Enterosoma merdigallinarum]